MQLHRLDRWTSLLGHPVFTAGFRVRCKLIIALQHELQVSIRHPSWVLHLVEIVEDECCLLPIGTVRVERGGVQLCLNSLAFARFCRRVDPAEPVTHPCDPTGNWLVLHPA